MNQDQEKNSIERLGEFGLIKHLTSSFALHNASSIVGVGDDCAVIHRDDTTFTLISSELFLENIHFDLMYVPLKQLGFKAVSASVSDVYAMNGMAEQGTVNIGFSSRFPLEAIEELYEGIRGACDFFNVDLIGGDTSSSSKGLMISVTAIGKVEKQKVAYRRGASSKDILMVSGDLGSAYLGLQILE